MTPYDRDERGDKGAEGERVVVRDRRRIDPITGAVRVPVGEEPAGPVSAGEQPAEPVPAPEVSAVADRIVELTDEVAERTADLQRISAEYANYRRRVDRDREAVLVGARVQFVSELLTVLDDLDRAELHGDLNGPFKAVADKVVAVVQKLGLESFGMAGEPFDPSVHEAVQHDRADATGPAVTVVSDVLRRGYRIADRVLRPAMVTVVDRLDDATAATPADEPATEPLDTEQA